MVRLGKPETEQPGIEPYFEEGRTQMAYVVSAATEDRYGLAWSNDIAIGLLNQVGAMVGERLEDLGDFYRVLVRDGLGAEVILKQYKLNPGGLEVSIEQINKMIEILREHFTTVVTRESLGVAGVFDLDHTILLKSYKSSVKGVSSMHKMFTDWTKEIGDDETYAGQAWVVALMSPLEAFTRMRKSKDYDHYDYPYDWIKDEIEWCRRAVGFPKDLSGLALT